jgi:hypothetical protein
VLIATKDESSALILALQNSALNLEPKIPQNQKFLPKEKNLQNPNFFHQIGSREFLPRSTDDTERARRTGNNTNKNLAMASAHGLY